jgi:hypothetical protein
MIDVLKEAPALLQYHMHQHRRPPPKIGRRKSGTTISDNLPHHLTNPAFGDPSFYQLSRAGNILKHQRSKDGTAVISYILSGIRYLSNFHNYVSAAAI